METIKKYRLELDAERHPVLCKEAEYLCARRLNNPDEVVALCNSIYRLQHMAEEYVIMLATDVQGRILGVFEVSHGSANQSMCNAREIYIRAVAVGASGVFIVHNHPSGYMNPSEDDLKCARKLKDAGTLLGIKLVDFLIIGNKDFYSWMEHGNCLNE